MRNTKGRRLMALLLSALMLLSLCAAIAENPSAGLDEEECKEHPVEAITHTERSERVYTQISGNGSVHTVTVRHYQAPYCNECNHVIGEEVFVGADEPFTQAHHYVMQGEEVVCADCGYKCTHPTVNAEEEIKWDKIDEEITEQEHAYAYEKYSWHACAVCGFVTDEVKEEIIWERSAHTYDENGVCGSCGYSPEHEHVLVEEPESVWSAREPIYTYYWIVDAQTHRRVDSYEVFKRCPGCKDFVVTDERDLFTDEEHVYVDGICVCGQREDGGFGQESDGCAHENIWLDEWFTDGETEQYNEKYHRCIDGYHRRGICCEDCGAHLAVSIVEPQGVMLERHEFDDEGVCHDCGYVNTCEHENRVSVWDAEYYSLDSIIYGRGKPIDTGRGTHIGVADVYVRYMCLDCEAEWDEEEVKSVEVAHVDYDTDSKCDLCGAVCDVCEHERGMEKDTIKNGLFVYALDDSTHVEGYTTLTHWVCPLCGERWAESDFEYIYEETAHTFQDGRCTVCDYENTCAHDNTETRTEVISVETCEPVDDAEHVVTGGKVRETTVCKDCGEVLDQVETAAQDQLAAHTYVQNAQGEYVCEVCVHVCGHSESVSTVEYENVEYANVTDQGHSFTGQEVTVTTCEHCDYVKRTPGETVSKQDVPHSYAYDEETEQQVCTECSHVCEHTGDVNIEEVFLPEKYASNGAQGHTAIGDIVEAAYCEFCDLLLSSDILEEDVSREEAHTLKDGKCALCGYVVPGDASDAADEEASVEPNPRRMAVVLANSVNILEEKYGQTLEIRIVNAEEVLAAQEMTALESLPVVEQIMVVLEGALSLQGEVDYALKVLDIALSDEALALIETVGTRIAAMTAEEKTAYDAQVAELFELEPIDGADAMVIALEIATQDETRIEAYIFREQADGTWTLYHIDITEPNA